MSEQISMVVEVDEGLGRAEARSHEGSLRCRQMRSEGHASTSASEARFLEARSEDERVEEVVLGSSGNDDHVSGLEEVRADVGRDREDGGGGEASAAQTGRGEGSLPPFLLLP